MASVSCTNGLDDTGTSTGGNNSAAGVRSADVKVTANDIKDYLEMWPYNGFQSTCTPYPSESDPLLYIINYSSDRWQLISSDRRTAPVLAFGKGKLDMQDCNPNFAAWVNVMASEIKALSSCPDEIPHSAWNEEFWNSISNSGEARINNSLFGTGIYPPHLVEGSLPDPYGMKTFSFTFNDMSLNPYDEIRYQVLKGSPVMVLGHDNNTDLQYSCIIDRVFTFCNRIEVVSWNLSTNTSESDTKIDISYYFGMRFGQNGLEDEAWFADPSYWFFPEHDTTSRIAKIYI